MRSCRLPSGAEVVSKFSSTGELSPETKFEEFGACDPCFSKVGVLLKLPLPRPLLPEKKTK